MRAIMEPKTEKMALFIDGANLYATAKSLGFDLRRGDDCDHVLAGLQACGGEPYIR